MARKMTEWPSKRGPITKIMPSDGCIGDTVPLAVGKWYDFHEFGWYMGNVGLNKNSSKNSSDIAGILLANLEELGDPEQDNVSFCVVKIRDANRSNPGYDMHADVEAKKEVPFNSCRSDGEFAAAARQSFRRPLSFLRRPPESRDGTI